MRDDRAVASPGPPKDARGGAAAMLMRRVDCLRSSGGAKAAPPMRAFSCDVVTGPNVTRRLLMMTTPHASLFPLCLQQTLHELCFSRHFFNRRTNRHNFASFFPAGGETAKCALHCCGSLRERCGAVILPLGPSRGGASVLQLLCDPRFRPSDPRERVERVAARSTQSCPVWPRERVWLSRTTR